MADWKGILVGVGYAGRLSSALTFVPRIFSPGVEVLNAELLEAMALCGAPTIADIVAPTLTHGLRHTLSVYKLSGPFVLNI